MSGGAFVYPGQSFCTAHSPFSAPQQDPGRKNYCFRRGTTSPEGMADETSSEAVTHAPWQREFFKNIKSFIAAGLSEDESKDILVRFLKLSSTTPMPDVMQSFRDEAALEKHGVHTKRRPEIRDFMARFLGPLLKNFQVEGKENLKYILPLMGRFPMTLISNHLSHMDAAAIYYLLYNEGGDARKLADSLTFIAGRLAFEPDFTRLGLYMIDSLLVCSKRDMSENPGLADLMTRINMRSFRQSQSLQKEGKVLVIFPEGTRSRTGKLVNFVDTVYHYVANKVIIPFAIEGSDEILPTGSFMFVPAKGRMVIGRPVLVGKLPSKQMEELPDSVQQLEIPPGFQGDKKQFVIDQLASLIGSNLHRHRHGTYRNLYLSETGRTETNILIRRPESPVENIVVIGHSTYGTALASVLANKKVNIRVYVRDAEKAAAFNEKFLDADHYPLFKLPPNVQFTADPADVRGGTLFVQAARPWELEDYYAPLKDLIRAATGPIVNVTKGFTGSEHGLILDDLHHVYGLPRERLAVLAGANYPDQVMERKLTGYEVAATNPDVVTHLAMLFSTGYVFTRPAINADDVTGVQLGGALKNIYALGVGLLDGYYEKNLGGNSDNSLFHVSNRIFKELTRLGTALGGKESTFQGLSGMTDLMLSCFGQDARDRQYGHDFVYGNADPGKRTSGLFGLQMLPRLVDLAPDRYPVAYAIHAVIFGGVDLDRVLEELIYQLRRY